MLYKIQALTMNDDEVGELASLGLDIEIKDGSPFA